MGMNRGDLLLTEVRRMLSEVGIFDVVTAQRPEIDKSVKVEAYAYIIKDSLERSMMEDSRLHNQLHFVDVGVLFRWNNTQASNNRGSAAEQANDIIARVEAALYTMDIVGKESTDGIRTHTIHQINVTESYGYMDASIETAETALLLTAHVTTTIDV
jgi:hypothetical protein